MEAARLPKKLHNAATCTWTKKQTVNDRNQPPEEPAEARRPRRNAGGVTLRELAKMVGVTKVTVSRALNNPELVSPLTLQRVQEAVRQTGYVPNLVAGSLASNRSRLVVALLPSLSGSVFQETISALTAALSERGYQLLIGQSGYDDSREDALIEAIVGRRPAGLMLTGTVHSALSKQKLRAADIPIVETWDLTQSPIDMLVGFSHRAVGEAAADYLHARGARHVAVITPDDPRALTRSAAFEDVMKHKTGNPVPIHKVAAPTQIGDGRHGLATLLAQHPDLDGVFCAADSLALGVLIEAQARGLRVPEKLRVLGYGDLNFAAHTEPPLSTMRVDGTRIGQLAATMLVERIEGRPVQHAVVDVGFQLIERGST